jgi:hypothetical protein
LDLVVALGVPIALGKHHGHGLDLIEGVGRIGDLVVGVHSCLHDFLAHLGALMGPEHDPMSEQSGHFVDHHEEAQHEANALRPVAAVTVLVSIGGCGWLPSLFPVYSKARLYEMHLVVHAHSTLD